MKKRFEPFQGQITHFCASYNIHIVEVKMFSADMSKCADRQLSCGVMEGVCAEIKLHCCKLYFNVGLYTASFTTV